MSLFSKFRAGRPSLTDPDPEQRLRALSELAPPNDAQARQLDELARSDPDDRVRRRAVGRSTNEALLFELLDDDAVGDDAAERLVALDASPHGDHPRLVRALLAAGHAPAPGSLAGADASSLIELTLSSRGDALDELLGRDEFRSAATLTRLERQSRNRNKQVNRFARERLDAIKTLRERCRAHHQRLEELLAALEKHSAGDPGASGYRDKHGKLEAAARAELEALTGAVEALAGHAETPVQVEPLQRRLEGLPPLPAPAVARPDPLTSVAPTSANPFEALTAEFRALGEALATSSNFEALAELRQSLTDRWLESANHAPPDESQHRVFEQVSHRFRELAEAVERLPAGGFHEPPELPGGGDIPTDARAADELWRQAAAARRWLKQDERTLSRVGWPEWAPPAPALAAARSVRDVVQDRLRALDQAADGLAQSLESRLAELIHDIDTGASASAQHLLSEIRQSVRCLPRGSASPLERLLNQQAGRLGELKDWQAFATSPKRDALCESMAALAESPLDPPIQAERIKELRAEWNALGPPTSRADRALADRFDADAERAFEPCRKHFSAQAEIRAANLEARRQICVQLEHYLESTDWPHADIKAAQQILRTARSEWQRFHPVDRKAGRPLETQFERLQSSLHEHIRKEWDRNLSLKREIVAEAEAIAEADLGVGEKVASAKDLQRRWQTVGPTPRKPDQQLWRQFRAACDRIFDSRDEAARAADDAIAATQADAEKLLDEFAGRLEAEGPDSSMLRDYEARFHALPRLPERLLKPLERRFAELERELRAQLRARAAAEREREIRTLVESDATAPAGERIPDEVTVRRLVLEAELAAEFDSPPEDRELRMALQVELMNAGRSREALDADALDLARRWHELGPKPAGVEALRERFANALKALNAS